MLLAPTAPKPPAAAARRCCQWPPLTRSWAHCRVRGDPTAYLLAYDEGGNAAYAVCRSGLPPPLQRALAARPPARSPRALPPVPPLRSKGFGGSGAWRQRTSKQLQWGGPVVDPLTGAVCQAPACRVLAGVECVVAGAEACPPDAAGNVGSANAGRSSARQRSARLAAGLLGCPAPRPQPPPRCLLVTQASQTSAATMPGMKTSAAETTAAVSAGGGGWGELLCLFLDGTTYSKWRTAAPRAWCRQRRQWRARKRGAGLHAGRGRGRGRLRGRRRPAGGAASTARADRRQADGRPQPPGYTPALFAGVRPALLELLSQTPSAGGSTFACAPTAPRAGKTFTVAVSAEIGGPGRKGRALALAASLHASILSRSGWAAFQARVSGAVTVDVSLPLPAWMPAGLDRRVVNATVSMQVVGLFKSLPPSRQAVFAAGLESAIGGARRRRCRVL